MHNPNSSYKLFCVGVVAENKPLSTNNILFVPLEKTGMMQGELVSNPQQIRIDGVDGSGNKYTVVASIDSVLEAEWRNLDTARTTGPDVQRGEQVNIWRMGDSNKYYWEEKGDGKAKRSLETIQWAAQGKLGQGQAPQISLDTHYIFEMSGHKKSINLMTSGANGEKAKYGLSMDGGNGLLNLGDASNNSFSIDSVNMLVQLLNSMETCLRLDKKDFYVRAQDDGIMSFARLLIELKETGKINVGKTLDIIAGERINLKAKDIALTGLLHLNGPITQDPGSAGNFTASMIGPFECQNEGTFNGIKVTKHNHTTRGIGDQTTKPTGEE